jgi:hypothetical protein
MMHDVNARVTQWNAMPHGGFCSNLDTFPVFKNKEKKDFWEFMSKRKCLEEFDRIGKVMGNG